MAWDITRTEGGQVIISFGQLLDAMVIDKGASKNVTSANTLAATPSVTNNGTLNIDLSAATAPENKNNHHPLPGRHGSRCRREHGDGQRRDHHASE